MSDRYITTDQGWRCYDCGGHVYNRADHDAFHARIDRLTDMRVNRRGVAMVGGLITDEPPLTSITATDWQAAHDAGEGEELRVGVLPNEEEPRKAPMDAPLGKWVPHGAFCECPRCNEQFGAPVKVEQPPNPAQTEPPVGSVARCAGCGNVYVHRADGWLATDGPFLDSWGNLARSFCGPVKVIYNPEEDK